MSKTNAFETDILELIFSNTTLAGIGDATGLVGSTADGNLYISLHTADPTDTGGIGDEADYTGYDRVAVGRASGWSVSSGVASNVAAVTFAACTGGSNTVTHFGICKAGTSGVADLIYSGALTSSLAVSSGITPEFAIGALTVTED
jgi:hypothetical protein